MDFIKLLSCIILVSVLLSSRMCFAYSESENDDMPMELDRLLDELTSLKNKLDEWFKRNNNNKCGNGTSDEYFGVVANFLVGNKTSSQENNSTKPGFFKSVKQKILNLVRGKNSTESAPHVRRCISSSIKIPKSKPKNQNAENFHQYLTKVINCLETNKKTVRTSGEKAFGIKFIPVYNLAIFHPDGEEDLKVSFSIDSEKSTKESLSDREENASASKLENILMYMADSHHTVEEAGRAGFKPPDLRKTQQIIDSVKNSMINLNMDDETTSTTCNPFDVNQFRKRSIFDDFAKKFESKSPKFEAETKTNVKMKENELFDGMLKIDDDFREMGGGDEYEEHQEPIIDEGKLLDNDLNALSSKLDSEQRLVGIRVEK